MKEELISIIMKWLYNKTLIIIILVLAVTAGILIYYNNVKTVSDTTNANNTKQKIIIGVTPFTNNLPLFVAKEHGFFDKNGVAVDFVPFQEGSQITNALFLGKIDGGLAAVPNFLSAQSSSDKLKIRIISVQIEDKNNPLYGLIVSNNITSFQYLNGKKIGYFPTSPATVVALETLLEKLDIDAVKIKLSSTTLIPAIEAGNVDAIFSIDPQLTLAKRKNLGTKMFDGKGIVAESMNITPLPVSAYIISDDLFKSQPVLAKKFMLSIDQAIDFIRKNPDEARRSFMTYLPEQQRALIPYFPIISNWKSTEIKADKIKAYQQLLLEKGILKKPVNIESLLVK